LHWVRNCAAPGAIILLVVLGGLGAGQASGVMISRPPARVVPARHQRARSHQADAAEKAAQAAQAAAALAELKALFAMPSPAAPPTLALTPPAPRQSGPGVPATVPAAAPATAVPAATQVPPRGRATAFGCAAAVAYLEAYAAPDFIIACAIDPDEHQATTTCISGTSPCNLGRFILIADPCAAAYMNEASNSWVLMGLSDAPIDPYGRSCG
jgi:hypothetical protein